MPWDLGAASAVAFCFILGSMDFHGFTFTHNARLCFWQINEWHNLTSRVSCLPVWCLGLGFGDGGGGMWGGVGACLFMTITPFGLWMIMLDFANKILYGYLASLYDNFHMLLTGGNKNMFVKQGALSGSSDWLCDFNQTVALHFPDDLAEHIVGEATPYDIYSRNHFSNLFGLHSLRSESSNLTSEKHPGNWQESSETLTKDFGPSVFHQQQSAFVSKLLDHSGAEDTGPYPPRQDLNQYPFGSTYDKYMTQLSSCSTDTRPHIFSTQYVNSPEMANTTVPLMNDTIGESSFSFSHYMNPCRINLDYFDSVWNEQKGLGYQTTDKQHGKWSNPDDKATVGNYSLNSLGESHLNPEHLGNGRPMQGSSEMKHELGSFSSKVSSSESGFVQPRECSSEFPEVNNTSVDSPCWKGTPAQYQPSFGIIENNGAPPVVIGTVGYINSHQNQKLPELSFEYPWRFCEHQVSGSENDPFKAVKLPERCKISKDHKVLPIDVRVLNDMTTHASYLPDKQHPTTQKCNDSGEDSKNVITSSQQESSCSGRKPILLGEHGGSLTGSISELMSKTVEKEESTHKRGEDPSQCYPGVEGNMLNMSSESSSSNQAIFLKLMHNLSVVLLSTCKGGSSLQEDEEELLQSVIQNLTAASSKRSKVEQKNDDGLSNSSQMKFKDINYVRKHFWRSMHEDSEQENADSEFKATVSQVLTNHQEDKVLDNTEVPQASIYRNLWIEAEASACKLKYELQHALLKLETAKGLNDTIK
ncbi:hypothetical protein ACJX0J_007132, partial [Zea mays]